MTMHINGRFLLLLLLLLPLTACLPAVAAIPDAVAEPDAALPTRMAVATVPVVATWTPRPTVAIPPTNTPIVPPTAAPTATPTPAPTATPDPYAGWTIADLRARDYGSGALEIVETLAETAAFTRYLIRYPSDGLAVYGFMNVPANASGPLPVVLLLHGYVNPAAYDTLAYTTAHADDLARNGFLVIHPNYRNYPPSDTGDNDFRAGFAIDVLHLIALVQRQGGQPGPLQAADPADINLWGHSMGGGIALRVLVVNPSVRRALLYGSMSADEYQNYEQIFAWTDGRSGQEELAIPPADMARIAPLDYLDSITAEIQIHHGTADEQVPFAWSVQLCDALRALSKPVTCFTYTGQPHYFWGEQDALLRQRAAAFFR
ncbi:MAG: alpha/beta fold hydrolase [Anaerolineales bacterium]|nr:alpha/beta fold hydrolase [Anaerolineales bacterium]